MNAEHQQPWSPGPGAGEEDFNFLDFNDVDLSFPAGDSMGDANTQEPMDITQNNFSPNIDPSQMSTPVSTAFPSGDSLADMAMQQQMFQQHMHQQQQHPHQHHPASAGMRHPVLRSQHGQQAQYYRQGMVPPTPNTVEMQGAQIHTFTDSQALGMYEAGKHQDQMVFTPLVSPAFQMQEYSTPNEYFSPLTSPALEAQEFSRASHANANRLHADEAKAAASAINSTKKAKRRPGTGKDPVHAVRSSPAMKAQQKRFSASAKTSKDIADVVAGLGALQQNSPALSASGRTAVLQSQADSETGSISPEPLSEVLMPPPAAPRSISQGRSSQSSPHTLQGKVPAGHTPATPASLFRIPKPSDVGSTERKSSKTPQPSPLNTSVGKGSAPSTPNLGAQDSKMGNTTPKSNTSRPISSAPTSAMTGSPHGAELGSPALGVPAAVLKDQPPSSRGNKKRSSSSHVSPALRPRISPSIKPLLPGGANLDSETTALLLANKSNYERIIDGSASQLGVNFPAQLSENLTSKRTSHKLAEQGRRNRINTALQEIQVLIPEGLGRDNSDVGSGSNASKAKTVENAISYIKMLQSELELTKGELAEAQRKLAGSAAAPSPGQVSDGSGTSVPDLIQET